MSAFKKISNLNENSHIINVSRNVDKHDSISLKYNGQSLPCLICLPAPALQIHLLQSYCLVADKSNKTKAQPQATLCILASVYLFLCVLMHM